MTQGVNDDVSISLRIKKTHRAVHVQLNVKYYISGVYVYIIHVNVTCTTCTHVLTNNTVVYAIYM